MGSSPNYIITFGAKHFDHLPRKVLVSEKQHLSWNWIALILVSQVARVGQTCEDIISRDARIASQKLTLGLASREEFENELYR